MLALGRQEVFEALAQSTIYGIESLRKPTASQRSLMVHRFATIVYAPHQQRRRDLSQGKVVVCYGGGLHVCVRIRWTNLIGRILKSAALVRKAFQVLAYFEVKSHHKVDFQQVLEICCARLQRTRGRAIGLSIRPLMRVKTSRDGDRRSYLTEVHAGLVLVEPKGHHNARRSRWITSRRGRTWLLPVMRVVALAVSMLCLSPTGGMGTGMSMKDAWSGGSNPDAHQYHQSHS